MILKSMICQERTCRHFRGAVGPSFEPTYVCLAFPQGIPDDVLSGANLHMAPLPNDGGYHFQPTVKQEVSHG